MIEAYEDALKNSNKELECKCNELKRENQELKNWLNEMQNENRVLKAQMDIVHLIFGR